MKITTTKTKRKRKETKKDAELIYQLKYKNNSNNFILTANYLQIKKGG